MSKHPNKICQIIICITDARDKMDVMLSSENVWAEVNGSEDLKVTEAAETFLTLLSTMTERYSILPQPGHRFVYFLVNHLQI